MQFVCETIVFYFSAVYLVWVVCLFVFFFVFFFGGGGGGGGLLDLLI